jgi:GTP pyrophosphokinase
MYSVSEIIGQIGDVTNDDKQLIKDAYSYAEKAHADHKRYSGEPYMIHLADVGYKLAAMGMSPHTIAAGLLHDSIEDTPVTTQDIKDTFGDEILFLVDGVTKLSSVRYHGTDRHNESLRKLFVATSQDIRVLIIKLVDRLHNMETLDHIPKEKQLRIARETLEIYVPVAHRLGMGKLRKELEDLAFPYVYPEEASHVRGLLEQKARNTNQILEKERKLLQRRLAESMRDFRTFYRVKGIYSLYHKLKRKEWDINNVYDLLAMRVIVPSVEDCYAVLGIVHKLWRPLPKRMKDYIAFPKPNGYQSIHTTVTTQNGVILEIQIRTERMHQEAEFGVASHIFYKKPVVSDKPQKESMFATLVPSLFRPFRNRADTSDEYLERTANEPHHTRIPRWVSQIGQAYNKDDSPTENFVDDMRSDFFSNRIFVFTPIGDVVDLPVGATPIDFAYTIHSEVGNHTFGVMVNKKMVQLDTELKNGDIVEIDTRKSAKPSPKWLDFAKTSVARRKIRAALEAAKQ